MSTDQTPLLENATRDLARFGAGLRLRRHSRRKSSSASSSSVLDSIGCCLFGATLPWTRKVAELADGRRRAARSRRCIGMGRKTLGRRSRRS